MQFYFATAIQESERHLLGNKAYWRGEKKEGRS